MGESEASRTDYNAVSDYNVAVQGIVKDTYTLGYFGLSYYEENKRKDNRIIFKVLCFHNYINNYWS